MGDHRAKITEVAIARAVVRRANGTTEVYYSYESIPIWQLGRWWKQRKHLAFMRAEDRKAGY